MIRAEDVRLWHAHVTATAGQDQAAKGYRLLRAILNSAVDDDRISRNPCRIRGAGIERTAERPMIDAGMVLELATVIDKPLRVLVLLAGFAGLRTGELLGLQRHDIDAVHAVIHVRRQAQEVVKADSGAATSRVLTTPKSEAGSRTVAMPRSVMVALEAHLEVFTGQALDAPVFVSKHGRPLRRADLSAAWRLAVKVVGAPEGLRVHDLRHHAATTMARMPGVTTKELMARIGHRSPRAALIYQHATNERDRVIADFMEGQIAAAQGRAREAAEGPQSGVAG
jgi:integrase